MQIKTFSGDFLKKAHGLKDELGREELTKIIFVALYLSEENCISIHANNYFAQ